MTVDEYTSVFSVTPEPGEVLDFVGGSPHLEAITFEPADVFSKWGFNDGDLLDDLLAEWMENNAVHPRAMESGLVLYHVVERLVLPNLPHRITLERGKLLHNAARAATVNGTPVDDLSVDDLRRIMNDLDLLPVTIPVEEILQEARTLLATGRATPDED